MKLGQRDPCPPDVAGVGPIEKTDPEDLRRERERCLAGGDIERRQRDQVPEAVDCPLALAMVGEPVAETGAVE